MFDCGMMGAEQKHAMTKADIWFLAGVFAIALVLLLLFRMGSTPGSYAEVSCDGTVLMQIPLTQDVAKYYLYYLSADGPMVQALPEEEWEKEAHLLTKQNVIEDYNIILCHEGEIRMLQSNCPDLICVHHSAISKTGENIICLPHQVIIQITGGKEQELDGVVY